MSRARGSSRVDAARLVRRHRRVLAGLAAAASIATLGMALQPAVVATRGVVVAAADLPTGRALVTGDLTVAEVPSGVLPSGASGDPHEFLGQVLAAPMARGEVIAGHRLTGMPAWSVPPRDNAHSGALRRPAGSGAALRGAARGRGGRLRPGSRRGSAVRLSG
ncbi:MAG TPA: SAF domain-containing protein, partial [Candidatus Limnocylindrales bacterium]|nr:SAF domain-containing protein [Candidatus Limnocylindrales bacterium]